MASDTSPSWRIQTKIEGRGLGFVDWQPGLVLPRRFTATVDRDDLPYLVELELTASEGGVVCRGVRYSAQEHGEPVTARRLRDVPLAECVRVAAASAAMPVRREGDKVIVEAGAAASEPVSVARTPREEHGTDRHLRKVAEIINRGGDIRAVQQHPEWAPVAYSTAARWVKRASKYIKKEGPK